MEGRIQQNSLINTIHKDNLAAQIIGTLISIQATTISKELLGKARMSTTSLGRISLLPKTRRALLGTSPKTCNLRGLSRL